MNAEEEMDRLIAAFVDNTLDEQECAELTRKLKGNPDALRRLAEAVSFEMELADAASPDHLEIVQQRRMVIERASGRPVVMESTDRVARPGTFVEHETKSTPASKGTWLPILLLGIAATAGMTWLALRKPSMDASAGTASWISIPLKNPGFEEPQLALGESTHSLPNWQDKILSYEASIKALPPGEAHSGSQVVMFPKGGHLKQLLFDQAGQPITFAPGLRIRVSGWVKAIDPPQGKQDALHVGLHHVVDPTRMYVVNYQIVSLDGGGWRRFSEELNVPENDSYLPSFSAADTPVASVSGRQILLTIDNVTYYGTRKLDMMLDDLTVEILPPPDTSGKKP